jgi:uncharacterized protein (DUF1697 family)
VPKRTSYVALLRAVNLAGRNAVSMTALRELLGGMGLIDPVTLLQSGNAVFAAGSGSPAKLEGKLEAAIAGRFGFEVRVLVRSHVQWLEAIERNPFPREATADPGHLLLLALERTPAAGALGALREAISGRERVELDGRTLYAVYPDGVGTSKLTTALIERKLGAAATGRNWNTVLKLAALLDTRAAGG